jgi:geranylgeranyl diphosphate synthase, type I
MAQEDFFSYLKSTSQKVTDYLLNSNVIPYLKPEHIKLSVLSYIKRSSKRLRPAVLLLSCGSVGGDEEKAIGAAAGVELFHTWTLVHDDVIDNDNLRRGEPTVHKHMEELAKKEFLLSDQLAKDYGRDIAILTGDVQHGWCVNAFIDCAFQNGIDSKVILTIIQHLQSYVLNMLVYGEVLDVQLGLRNRDIMSIHETEIIHMLWLKTGVLYEFSSLAGAMIGKNSSDMKDPEVIAITEFTKNCGIAFQLQDDVLGVTGDQNLLGKPVGSDIREGKKTTILLQALKNASSSQKKKILDTLGNKAATEQDIEDVKQLFIDLKGIEYTTNLAQDYINKALPQLNHLPDTRYKRLLSDWANFMIDRKF